MGCYRRQKRMCRAHLAGHRSGGVSLGVGSNPVFGTEYVYLDASINNCDNLLFSGTRLSALLGSVLRSRIPY